MTRRQKDVLVALYELHQEKGYPPALRDLATRCGLSHNAGTITGHIRALERKGLVLGPSSEGCVRQYRAHPDVLVVKGEPWRIVAVYPQEGENVGPGASGAKSGPFLEPGEYGGEPL